jgi:Domain of unknown function (DUF5020)
MKFLPAILGCMWCFSAYSQSLQLHYDFRHTLDPKHADKNFPTFYFEYFKNQDSGKAFIKPGSFLLKMQADFLGEHSNMGKFYMQVSQSFRCWTPKLFINLQYSGGLGITEPRQYSYYILNTYSIGLAYPFQWIGGYWSTVLHYKWVPYPKPTQDPLFTLYWWKGLFHYKLEISGDFSIWTENKNHGDEFTKDLKGKRFYFFAEPQCWYNISKTWAVGTRISMNYHVLTTENLLQVYPTLAIRCKR